ncbi:MAG: hypothetical protein JO287_17270 [Pseudonocardiales bacterium]|nr:hypothetical protein [Pseudonocardiales bacterium]
MGVWDTRVGAYLHPEAAAVLEIDGRAPATACADDDHLRRLPPQVFDTPEVNFQQRLKHGAIKWALGLFEDRRVFSA